MNQPKGKVMSKNLIKKVMIQEDKLHPDLQELINTIESGYLTEYTSGFKKKETFSPSTLVFGNGACPRYWYYAFEGAEFDSDVDAYAAANMQAGTDAHARIQKAMTNSGLDVEHEKKVKNEDPPISGFSDSVLVWKEKDPVIEIKTMREESFAYRQAVNKPPPYHLEQLIIYMKVFKVANGILLYESKNSHMLHAIAVEITPEYVAWVDNAFEWMREVRKAWEDKTLPTKPYRSNSKVCKKCPVKATCFAGPKGDVKLKTMEHLK